MILFVSNLRRVRDSNPRTCYSQQFSRLPQSTTLPTLLKLRLYRCFQWCKYRTIFNFCKTFSIQILTKLNKQLKIRSIIFIIFYKTRPALFIFLLFIPFSVETPLYFLIKRSIKMKINLKFYLWCIFCNVCQTKKN